MSVVREKENGWSLSAGFLFIQDQRYEKPSQKPYAEKANDTDRQLLRSGRETGRKGLHFALVWHDAVSLSAAEPRQSY